MFLVLISPILWISSIIILKDWKHFWKFFIANTVIILIYLILIFVPDLIDLGHDEYGLKKLMMVITAIFTHIILGVTFAIGYRLKIRKAKAEN